MDLRNFIKVSAMGAACFALAAAPKPAAADVGSFYRGKTMTMYIGVSADGQAYLVVEMTLRNAKEATLTRARTDVQQVIDGFLVEDAHSRAAGRLRAIGIHDQYSNFDALLAEAKRRGFPRRMLEANVAVFHGLSLFVNGDGIAKQIAILHGADNLDHAEPWKKTLSAENRRELVIMPAAAKSRPTTKGSPDVLEPDLQKTKRKPSTNPPPTADG